MSQSFKDLYEQGAKNDVPKAISLRVGGPVTGVVSHVGPTSVFVELDGKRQGYFDVVDVAGPDGKVTLAVGDTVQAVVVSIESASGQIRLARKFSKDAGLDQLRSAAETGAPVEGKVVGVNKGGVAVEVGAVRGFCPMSQLDLRFVQDAAVYLQQTLEFRVTEIRGDREVVLSRRALLEEKQREAQQASLTRFTVGARFTGRVAQLRDFGAFVDVDGIEGLVPLRELSHDRSAKPSDVVTVGDVVEVEVIEAALEPAKKGPGERLRLTFSLKRLADDPWDGLSTLVPVGRVLAGTVVRLADFGAFVRLAEGIEGLLHISEVSSKARTASDVLSVGQQVMVVATALDRAKKRISLVLADDGAAAGAVVESRGVPASSVVEAKVEKVDKGGVFVQVVGQKGRAGRGFIPNSELGVGHGVDLRKHFPEGATVRAKVIEPAPRMRLSIKQAKSDEERADFDSFRAGQNAGSGLGTFGDLLKKKLGG